MIIVKDRVFCITFQFDWTKDIVIIHEKGKKNDQRVTEDSKILLRNSLEATGIILKLDSVYKISK